MEKTRSGLREIGSDGRPLPPPPTHTDRVPLAMLSTGANERGLRVGRLDDERPYITSSSVLSKFWMNGLWDWDWENNNNGNGKVWLVARLLYVCTYMLLRYDAGLPSSSRPNFLFSLIHEIMTHVMSLGEDHIMSLTQDPSLRQ